MKITLEWDQDLLLLRCRAYHRSGVKTITYMARITGPHPDYYLSRSFVERYCKSNARWDSLVFFLADDGVYELVIKRMSESGIYLTKERKWLVVDSRRVYIYDDEEMNYQYVLYCAWLIKRRQEVSA